MELLAELQQKGLSPGVITYNAASVLVRGPGNYYKQRELLDVHKGLMPDVIMAT